MEYVSELAKTGKAATFTFSESVENHKGMQIWGNKAKNGFSLQHLLAAKENFEKFGNICELVELNGTLGEKTVTDKQAHVLVIKKGIETVIKMVDSNSTLEKFVTEFESYKEQVDKKAYMYGRVVDKHARWNLCFADNRQLANFENKEGTILPFSDCPELNKLRIGLPLFIEKEKTENMFAELNYYYDMQKCGIGFHGDTERKMVIGARIGAPNPLHFQWYVNSEPIGERTVINLEEGDIYIMSEKAVGDDFKLKKIPTLRHAAGCKKFTSADIANKKIQKKKSALASNWPASSS